MSGRFPTVHRWWFAGVIALGFSTPATAAPRDPDDMGHAVEMAASRAYLHRGEHAHYRTSKRKTAAPGRPWTTRRARQQNRSNALHRSGAHRVAQISPTILRRADRILENGAPPRCTSNFRRRSTACNAKPARPKNLVDALLEAPSPATEPILKDLGIPAIKDVPPIAILRAGHPDAEEYYAPERR